MEFTPTDDELTAIVARRGTVPASGEFRAAQGALDTLYRRHAPALSAFLKSRCQADADDLHHNTWLKVWELLPTHYNGGNFRAWLFQVARNLLLDHVRRPSTEALPPTFDAPTGAATPDAGLADHERRDRLHECISKLPPPMGSLMQSRLGGEDYVAGAAALGLDPKRAHKLFHKAKALLRDCFGTGP